MEKINATHDGWFLPAIQRQYVWGSRYESEKYICKLFDSILRGYPIGTLIVWNTDKEIPYREFLTDYTDDQIAPFVDKSLYSRSDKWLVYDGQQRLQTLFSCLKYTLNNRVLIYNLFFDLDNNEDMDATGFSFIEKNENLQPGYISIPNLFIQQDGNKTQYRNRVKNDIPPDMLLDKEEYFETIIDKLWDVFVRKDIKSLAYFPIDKSYSEDRVNDIFQRLNSGGVPLSGADLLLSRIKEKNYNFEESLQKETAQISSITQGYIFEPNSILQLINLIIKETTRIDPSRIKDSELTKFIDVSIKLFDPLNKFFKNFLYDIFKINNKSIIVRSGALLPLIIYIYYRSLDGISFLKISEENINKMKQYFILSQLNDWNTQTIITECSKKAKNNKDFPLEIIKDIAIKNNRPTTIKASTMENYKWFTLKILTPNRIFISSKIIEGRYKPELDHIFPMKLKNKPKNYNVNVIWNLQPVEGILNANKGNTHPKEFFEKNKNYLKDYDFLPNMNNLSWNDHEKFINYRKKKMIKFMKNTYNIDIQ